LRGGISNYSSTKFLVRPTTTAFILIPGGKMKPQDAMELKALLA